MSEYDGAMVSYGGGRLPVAFPPEAYPPRFFNLWWVEFVGHAWSGKGRNDFYQSITPQSGHSNGPTTTEVGGRTLDAEAHCKKGRQPTYVLQWKCQCVEMSAIVLRASRNTPIVVEPDCQSQWIEEGFHIHSADNFLAGRIPAVIPLAKCRVSAGPHTIPVVFTTGLGADIATAVEMDRKGFRQNASFPKHIIFIGSGFSVTGMPTGAQCSTVSASRGLKSCITKYCPNKQTSDARRQVHWLIEVCVLGQFTHLDHLGALCGSTRKLPVILGGSDPVELEMLPINCQQKFAADLALDELFARSQSLLGLPAGCGCA